MVTPSSPKAHRKAKQTKPNKGMAKKAAAAATALAVAASVPNSSSAMMIASSTTSPYFARSNSSTSLAASKKSPSGRNKSPKNNSSAVARTTSFDAVWAGRFPALADKQIQVHTLILGTHPSIKSLEMAQYYGHNNNAFWWIAGDCLGFRRALGLKADGTPSVIAQQVRHDESMIIAYNQQLEVLASKGFALWDLVQSCKRPGSLDQDITDEVPNAIREFCQEHPTIRRIVLCNGREQAKLFKKHFGGWLMSGELQRAPDEISQKEWANVFKKDVSIAKDAIDVVVAMGVSPAAARFTYSMKRDFWEQHVYGPGLEDHERLQQP
jgi:G:T/U-mismatch repair DNA glycosylase